MSNKILWVDDEIDMLTPHILFLEKKGYKVLGINNALEALELIPDGGFSAVLLDENMPGIGGLEALQLIKEKNKDLPVIMVTKNEEEHIMEEAIGSQITDYILKPVNPNQIFLSLKKNLESEQLVKEKTTLDYQQNFRNISMELLNISNYKDWINFYQKLVDWELKLDRIDEESLRAILNTQKEEANTQFSKFIEKNYLSFLEGNEKPVMSHTLFKEWIRPLLKDDTNSKVLMIVIDNLRYDQWKMIDPLFNKYFSQKEEKIYYSILPSATQYARNALFAGLMPLQIEKQTPQYWLNDVDEGNKNNFENELLQTQLQRLGLGDIKHKYYKILNSDFERKILEDFNQYKNHRLVSIVYNFIDMLSHAKTDNQIVRELIRDDKNYRSLTLNWFENSSLTKIIEKAAENNFKVVITTDHGTIAVKNDSKVVGDKESSVNLRYKLGKNLDYNRKEVFSIDQPEKYQLPKINISSKYIFAKEDYFFVYPKNYNHFVNYYKDSYQHGGISMEEIMVPFTVYSK